MFPPLPERETATTVHGVDVTTARPSAYEEETERRRREVLAEQEAAIRKQTQDAAVAADVKSATERDLLKEMDTRTEERAKLYDQHAGAIARATERLSEARKKYEEAPTPQLFGDRDTTGKVMLGLGMVFGALGDAQKARAAALLGQQVSGPSFLTGIIQMDLQRQREKIEKLSDHAVMAQTGLKEAGEARQAALAEAEVRAAMAYKRVRQIGEATLASRGADKATIEGDQNLAALHAEEMKTRDSVGARYTEKIVRQGNDTTTTERQTKPPEPPKPGVEDVKATNQIDNDIEKLNRTIDLVAKNPGAWNEYRDNTEDWRRKEKFGEGPIGKVGRPLAQGIGWADIAPEQGLKTDDGRAVHQGMAQVQTSIAKGYGGVITEGDRSAAGSELAQLGLNADQAIATLQRTRDMLQRNREAFLQNRGVKSSAPAVPGGPAAAPPGEQSTAAGGAVHGTRDTRGDADVQPGASAPGPAVETPANNPDDPNSMAPLPEAPDADSLPEATRAATPRKLPGGVASLGKATQGGPVASPSGKVYSAQQAEYIALAKRNPGMKNAVLMRRFGLTEEDFR